MGTRSDVSSSGSKDSFKCRVDCGVEVDIDYAGRMVWVVAEKSRLCIAVALDDFADMGYSVKARTLGIALDSSLGYIEIPCSRQQAENIVVRVGWDVARLHIH